MKITESNMEKSAAERRLPSKQEPTLLFILLSLKRQNINEHQAPIPPNAFNEC